MTNSTSYTIAIRDKGQSADPWLYVQTDLSVKNTPSNCKPLSYDNAQTLTRLIRKRATEAGRPVECRIVRLGEWCE